MRSLVQQAGSRRGSGSVGRAAPHPPSKPPQRPHTHSLRPPLGSCLLFGRPEVLLLTEEATQAPEGARLLAALAADAALAACASLAPQDLVHGLSDTLTPQVHTGPGWGG